MPTKEVLEGLGLKPIRPLVYPGTYAIVKAASLMAEDVTNRSSASWKKAQHIFLDSAIPNKGRPMLAYWNRFCGSRFDGETRVQFLYIPVGGSQYVKYDIDGNLIAEGTLADFFS